MMNIKPNSGPGRLVVSLVVGLVLLLVVVVLLGRAFGASNEARTATPAPSFSLRVTGRLIKLADFKGKALIVCFFATGDGPSQKQAEILNDLLKEYTETNLAVLGLAFEQPSAKSTKSFAEELGVSFPVYAPDYDFVQAFGGLTAIPTMFVIDKNQNIIQKYVGVTESSSLQADLRAILKQ